MITTQEIAHLATLARITLTDDDIQSLAKEFDSILGYIDQLKKAPVTIDTESRVGAIKNIMRPDTVVSISADEREALLDEAPRREKDFVAVTKMIEQD